MTRLRLFEATGVEVEYMIADRASLDVVPSCDRLIATVSGEPVTELERGAIAWSNELALHVLELKTNGPAPTLAGLSGHFHREVLVANEVLSTLETKGGDGARLMPGGVHPWMEPGRETRLWPHEYNDVYRAFDRIFGCSGHGWSNLQSTHVNLPFGDDEEFARLHAAIRVVLPLIPALAAASPFLDGALQPSLDARLEAYGANARLVPEVAGHVVPEPVGSEQEYRDQILEPLYRALEPHDPLGILRHEWVNARGSIARFQRGAIEIRLIDAQECPSGDLTVVSLVVALVRALTEERWASVASLNGIETGRLAQLLRATIRVAHEAIVDLPELARAVGLGGSASGAGDVWRRIADQVAPDSVPDEYGSALEHLLERGPLAARMVEAHRKGTSIRSIAGSLVHCLAEDRLFDG